MATTTKNAPKTQQHNRLNGQQGGEAAAQDEVMEELTAGQRTYLKERQAQRKIKTDDDREMAKSLDDAVVKAGNGLPDMRFAENRNKFSPDTTKTVHGAKPDRRFLENRPDIMAQHQDRYSNVIFSEDGEVG